MKSRRAYWGLLTFVAGPLIAISTLSISYVIESLENTPVDAPIPAKEKAIVAAIHQISSESVGTLANIEPISAPNAPSGVILDTGSTASSPIAPDGYSFVEHHGQMVKETIVTTHSVPDEFEDDAPSWLNSSASHETLISQAKNAERDWVFGWIRLPQGGTVLELERAIQRTNGTIIGDSGRWVRVKLPANRNELNAIARFPEVDGLGTLPASVKLNLIAREGTSRDTIPVFVTLMDGDLNGRWRFALESLGAVVGQFDPAIRVYVAHATEHVLKSMARTDFVASIEPIGLVQATHDTAVAAMGADSMRMYRESERLFTGVGGASVPIAVMDSGLNINHLDISTNRSSICGANFVYFEPVIDDYDLWVDEGLHGTHVTGTIVGNGTVQPRFAGMAPLVEHIRFAKVLNHWGFGSNIFILRGMDFLANATACPDSGWSSERVKPLIVNMSLSASARIWEGRSVSERKLDSIVWDSRQLYVVAQSNEDIHGFSNYASAKNSLAVGAVVDSGELASFSSIGPTADGRLTPKVVGTGVEINSPAGDGSRGEYVELRGTSMSSPAVAGVAALLMDAVPAHKEHAALARARLMASAIRPDVWFEDPSAFPANNSHGPGELQFRYGLGKVSARTSVLNRNVTDGWTSGSVTSELTDGEYAYHDIHIPEGTSRLDLVLTWDEPPSDTLSSAVINDLDLWLDLDGDCEPEPCGDYASQSRVDNVEWIILSNPNPGTYRAKVAVHRVYTAAPRAALAWTTIRGSSTPNLEISVDTERVEFETPDDINEFSVTLTTSEYVAAGTRLQIDCRMVDGSACSSHRHWLRGGLHVFANRNDGVLHELRPARVGDFFQIGELAAGERWEGKVSFGFGLLADGATDSMRIYVKASSWNANPASVSVLANLAGTDSLPMESMTPSNDQFANALPIEGENGSVDVELVNAITEPGEPTFANWPIGRPAGSLWYEWQASADEMVAFSSTPHATFDFSDTVRMDAFRGDRIAALESVASANWGVQFFAEAEKKYRIRISYPSTAAPLSLNWSSGAQPVNGDFDAAAVIATEEEIVEGTNAGATLEPGEFFGDLASTVWYRWTAPRDGTWKFMTRNGALRILAFEGERMGDLRLVSGFAQHHATFAALSARVYHLAVATQHANASGQPFELSWSAVDREMTNDDFEFAEEIPGEESSSQSVGIDADATVEPNEPVESGIRTKWWSWTAPTDGRYTWLLEELASTSASPGDRMMVSVFSGDTLENLRLVATNGINMSAEFAFTAEADTKYHISVGVPPSDQWAYTGLFWLVPGVTLAWGMSPDNDARSHAGVLSGGIGSVDGSSRFATSAIGEQHGFQGRSTLWWTYEAPESGWIRFTVEGDGGPWALTIYQESAEGNGTLSVLASDLWQQRENEVFFDARAGTSYTITLGVRGGNGGEFTLRWEEAEDPGWLHNVGRVVNGDLDSKGNSIELRRPGDIEIDDSGRTLYLASEIGLQTFARNEFTGVIEHIDHVEIDSDLASAALVWDSLRNRLIATACGTWWSFTRNGDDSTFSDVISFQAVEDPGTCAYHREQLLIDADGSNLYRVRRTRIDHFNIEDNTTFRFVESVFPGGVLRAVLSNDDSNLYVMNSNTLRVYERNLDSGELTETEFEASIDAPYTPPSPLAIADDDAFLYVFDNKGERANLYSLADAPNPILRTSYSNYIEPFQLNRCRFAAIRSDSHTVDVFCPGRAFVVRWRADEERLDRSYSLIEGRADPFNVLTLNFGAPSYEAPTGIAESPDRRHIYLSTPDYGIVIFGRGSSSGREPESD
ncbi:MAG: S8 family serine peptidase [Gammaproteobacteria bacterium]|nr:S8 family serine peptidase [Gammaproteobacteria bacterium]